MNHRATAATKLDIFIQLLNMSNYGFMSKNHALDIIGHKSPTLKGSRGFSVLILIRAVLKFVLKNVKRFMSRWSHAPLGLSMTPRGQN
jgi:hypothetical protein